MPLSRKIDLGNCLVSVQNELEKMQSQARIIGKPTSPPIIYYYHA